jgi:hypothetical protein
MMAQIPRTLALMIHSLVEQSTQTFGTDKYVDDDDDDDATATWHQ